MTEKTRYNLKEILLLENYRETDELMLLRENPLQLIDKGYEYVDREEYSKAFRIFAAAADFDRSDPDVLNGLGISLCEMGLLDEAKKILEYAIELNPDDSVLYANMAGVYWEQCDYNQAVFNYMKALELDQDIEETYFNLINLYIEMGSLFMALITCNQFLDQFPENSEASALRNDIILNLGITSI